MSIGLGEMCAPIACGKHSSAWSQRHGRQGNNRKPARRPMHSRIRRVAGQASSFGHLERHSGHVVTICALKQREDRVGRRCKVSSTSCRRPRSPMGDEGPVHLDMSTHHDGRAAEGRAAAVDQVR